MSAIIVITLLVAATVGAIVRYALPLTAVRQVVLACEPDTPKPFGMSMAWIAVRSEDCDRIVAALGLTETLDANWNAGVGAIYDPDFADSHVFVSPPVRGFTFIAGVPLPLPAGRGFMDKLTPLAMRLGNEFKDVQYFASFPEIDLFAWLRIEKGRVVRAFAIGDEGVIWDRGRLTPQERALGLKLFELRGIKGRRGDTGEAIILHPTEEQVWRMASGWSLDPSRLDTIAHAPAIGLVARAPERWRSERVREAA